MGFPGPHTPGSGNSGTAGGAPRTCLEARKGAVAAQIGMVRVVPAFWPS